MTEYGDPVLAALSDIAYLRKLRAELDPLAGPPGTTRSMRITPRQQAAIGDMLRTIDRMFPHAPVLRAEDWQ